MTIAEISAGDCASLRYPDPAIEILDPSFLPYRLFNASVECLGSGLRWAEGPVWFGDGRYLLCSDIPNNRIVRWDETTGGLSVLRQPSNHSNGLTRDRQGRLIACEHLTRRVTRTEYDGSITVLADGFDGKRLNSPNDAVCKSDGSIWFSDPAFGISGDWEGDKAEAELPQAVYRVDGQSGNLTQVIADLAAPNGLCFSPDEKILYVVDSRATPHRQIWSYPVEGDGRSLGQGRLHIDAGEHSAPDGIKADIDGNLWCGWGSDGGLGADPVKYDGVRIFGRQGEPLAHIHLPERCANLCFGGAKRNRLFMAASHSLYTLYVATRGAV